MSDTAAGRSAEGGTPARPGPEAQRAQPPPASKPRGTGCCLKLALAGVLVVVAGVLYVVWATRSIFQDAAMEIPPLQWTTIEAGKLELKLRANELPSKLLGSSTDLELDERELNGLLFANEPPEHRTRIVVEDDRLRIEAARPAPDRLGKWVNVVATVRLLVGPEQVEVQVIDGRVGSYGLGPITRPWFSNKLTEGFAQLRARDRSLQRLKALWVEGGKVKMIYTQPK